MFDDQRGEQPNILRDPRVVTRFLQVLPRRHGWARRGLVVALGMLAERPDLEMWIDAAAGVFATVVADPATEFAAVGLPAGVRRQVQHALTQIEACEWLGAVD